MKRKNRLIVLENELKKFDREKLISKLQELDKKIKELKIEKQEIEKPFWNKIEELNRQIKQLKMEMKEAVYHIKKESKEILSEVESIKQKLIKRERLLNEKHYLEFLENIKKLVEKGWIIYKVSMEVYPYDSHEYELGELIGITCNWNKPSKITDIKISEKTFKIKSKIAKDYRSISLERNNYPESCLVILVNGIKPKETGVFHKSIICPNCKSKSIAGAIAHAKKKCPICDEEYYYVCESCKNIYYKEPQCEHKNIIREDGIKEKILHWKKERKDFRI